MTNYDYNQIFEDYLKTINSASERKMISSEVLKEADVFHMTPQEMLGFICHEGCGKHYNLEYQLTLFYALGRLFRWVYGQGIIQKDIFQTEELSLNVFIDYASSELPIRVYEDQDIYQICESFTINQDLFSVLLLLLYEGVFDKKLDMLQLKMEDISWDERKITVRGKDHAISSELISHMRAYRSTKVYEWQWKYGINRETQLMDYEDYFFKIPHTDSLEDYMYIENMRTVFAGYFKAIDKLVGYHVNYVDIFASGFVHWVKRRCESEKKNTWYFLNIFQIYPQVSFRSEISRFAKEYGIDRWKYAYKLRLRYYPYIVKSKYYTEK